MHRESSGVRIMLKAIAFILLSLFSLSATAKLTPLQIHSIQNGWHAPYSQEVIDQVYGVPPIVLPEQREFLMEAYIPNNYWSEPADNWMWMLFWGLQLADIYSTYEGVKYDCIKEANPLLPEIPTVGEMALLKGVILFPTYSAIGWDNITRAELVAPLLLGGFVVNNNFRLISKAERRCNLR